MIINELEGFYGKATDEEKQWVAERVETQNEEIQQNFLHALHQNHKKGFPSIFIMKGILAQVTGRRQTGFYWAVCLECGCEYDYNLPMCPSCYKNGLECRSVEIKTSELKPPAKVIRYNKQYILQNEKSCYDCEFTELSFCHHFGQVDWQCRNISQCKCASCCITNKRANEKIARNNERTKISYARPLKKINAEKDGENVL